MPEGLTVFLEGLLAYVGIAADYLVAHQSVLNLVLVFSTACLSILAVAAYVRPREAPEPVLRMPERRPFNGTAPDSLRPSEPKFDESKGAESEPSILDAAAMAPAPAPVPPTDTGHRLSRLEESFLQLNRDLTELEDSTKDMKQEIEILGMRLRQPVPYEEIEQPPPLAAADDAPTGMEMVEMVRSGDLVPHPDVGTALRQLTDMQQRVEDLSGAVESQRRTVLAIGQVVAQMPDWRKLRAAGLEQIAAATEPPPRRTG